MGKRLEDLNLSDEPVGRQSADQPRDLVAIARATGAHMRGVPAGEKTVLALYRCPDYLRWGVEALSEAATNGALEPAGNCLLKAGLSTIRQFPGVAEIGAARRAVLAQGSAETMHWFNNFPLVDVSAAGTDDIRQYRMHVVKPLAKEEAKLARSLGLSNSRLGILALMAGLLQVPRFSAPKYRKAMVGTLQDLRDATERRGREARARADAVPARDTAEDERWTIADVIGSSERADASNDDQ